MENFKLRSLFALGPAPPGCPPPNTSLFIRLESHLLAMSRRMKDKTTRIDRLRSAHRIETCTAMRVTIKEQVIQAIKDQIQARDVMAKYTLKLKALQEAEIMKVLRHMRGIEKVCQEKSNKLALLRVVITAEQDPAKIRCIQQDIYALSKEQEKAMDLRERWRLRLVQMEAAKVKVLAPPTSGKAVNASKKISTQKPKTDTKTINKVVTENIKKNISTPTPKTDVKSISNVEKKNIIKNVSTPKSKTGMEATRKVVVKIINNKVILMAILFITNCVKLVP
ncbi:hypothetical protein KR038_009028 [Drosophila bunnanda]|nr:hypothetical protein KR038_009028 [Drosophila bunnanda]